MRTPSLPTALRALFAVAIALTPIVAVADDVPGDDHAPSTHKRPELHKNHFGSFLGASTHLDTDETALTLGIEYARVLTPNWALAGYVEMVGGTIERDVIVAAGVIYYPTPGFGLLVAPGVELVNKDVEHDGGIEEELENEFLIRFGAGYGFAIASNAAVGPLVLADYAGDRWTVIYGIAWAAGF